MAFLAVILSRRFYTVLVLIQFKSSSSLIGIAFNSERNPRISTSRLKEFKPQKKVPNVVCWSVRFSYQLTVTVLLIALV